MFKRKTGDNHLISSLLFASAVLLFHVLLLAGIGLVVLMFRGIVHYFVWILLGGGLLIGAGLFIIYRHLQKEKSVIARMLESPEFKGRRVEVNFLGGLASFKIDHDEHSPPAIAGDSTAPRQLDSPGSMRVRELSELARLLEKDLISPEEYERAKDSLLNP